MILKERKTKRGMFVSLCDDGIIGKTFAEGKISLTVSESFYKGEEADESRIIESLQSANMANIVGHESVKLAIEAGVISEGEILEISDTLHAQFVRL